MRLLVPIALLGSFILVTGVQAQTLAEHAAAASGATIGTAAGKPLSNAITKIFGQTDTSTKKAANASVDIKALHKPTAEYAPVAPAAAQGGQTSLPSIGESAPARHGGFAPRPTVRQYSSTTVHPPAADVYIPELPRKEPTAEELASIQVGATEKELLAALGQPESKVTIPDDGHLLEICQYWSKGQQLGTVRLDNGQVVNIQSRTEN
jgi:hypothetical protein